MSAAGTLGALTPDSPGQTDRVARILAKANPGGLGAEVDRESVPAPVPPSGPAQGPEVAAAQVIPHEGDYQVMPRLSPEDYSDLEKSILENGVQVPIIVTRDGTIVDGHHRHEIATKHNLPCPIVQASEDDATKLRSLAFALNLNRRHLGRDERRRLLAESIKADPQLSDREHGRRAGASDKTAGAVRRDLEANAEIPHSAERVTATGKPAPGPKAEPAPKPQPKPAASERKSRSRPIGDDFRDEMAKWTPRIKRVRELSADGRVARNTKALSRYRNNLIQHRDALNAVIAQLGGAEVTE